MLITFGRADTATGHRHGLTHRHLRRKAAAVGAAGIIMTGAACEAPDDDKVLGAQETGAPIATPNAAYAIISESLKKRFGDGTEVGAMALHRDNQNRRPGSYYFAVAYRTAGNDRWYLIKSDFNHKDSNTLRKAVQTGTQITSGIDMDFGEKPRGTFNHGVDVNVDKTSGTLHIEEKGNGASWKKALSSGQKGQRGETLSLTSRLQTMKNDGGL